MKKAYLVTFYATTRVVSEETNEEKLVDDLSIKGRERILREPESYLMGDNLEYEEDEEIPFGESPEDECDGTEGQDRHNYTDTQDRENYIIDDEDPDGA